MPRAQSALHIAIAVAAALTGAGIACSGSSGGSGTPPGITLDKLCAELAKADCDRLQRCEPFKAPIDRERCLLRQAELTCGPYKAALQSAVDGGELIYSESGAKACRDRIAQLECTIGFDYDYFRDPACKDIVSGKSDAGQKCSFPFSCKSGLFCRAAASCPGMCQALKTNNDTCSATEPCVSDQFCAVMGMRCRGRAGLNAPCEPALSGNACAEGGFCDDSGVGVARCIPVRGRGNGCLTPYECAQGLRCITNLCSGGQEHDTCAADADCTGKLRCVSGRCGAPIEENAACSDTKPCNEGLVCTSSAAMPVCVRGAAQGASCSGSTSCYIGRCVNQTCGKATADGDACDTAADCLPKRTCKTSRCSAVTPSCRGS